ncbi:MAG TPA: nucleotidyltransferase, partial [Clostridiales bacterium]|nr:nucleotidyltransferase [Clostridiales bacterium]
TDSSFASATAIRHLLFHKAPKALNGLVPEDLIPVLMEAQRGGSLITEDDYSLLLKYVLMQNTPQSLADYLDFPISLANRAANTIQDFCSFSQFAEMLKTREITRVRINRALLHAVLQLGQTASPPSSIRMLGFRKEAAELLKAIKNSGSRMVIGKLADAPLETYREDLFASNLYHSVLAMKIGNAAPDERSIPLVII